MGREEVYSDLHRGRMASFQRWRERREAQDALPLLEGKLSLHDALKTALSYNKGLWMVLQEKAAAEGILVEARGTALPSLSLSAGYTRLDKLGWAFSPVTIGDKNNWFSQLDFTQPLFQGGAVPAAVRGAELSRFLSDEKVRHAIQDTVAVVARAYYDLLLAKRLYEVQEEALKFAQANLKDVEARQEQGLAIRYDRLRAELEVSSVQADLIRQRSEKTRARTGLFRAMGVSQSSHVELSDSLTYRPMKPDYEEAVRTAFDNRPALYQAELDSRLQREVVRGLKADYWPDLETWAWFRWAKPDPHDVAHIEWNQQWQAGLRFSWDLFDGWRRTGRLMQQRAVVRRADIRLSDTEQQVLQEVKNAILDLRDADELVQSQQLNLTRANEALRLVQVGAREGVNTELEVLDARSALTRVRGLYYQALHAHAVARLAYRRAVGLLGPPPGAQKVPEQPPELETTSAPAGEE